MRESRGAAELAWTFRPHPDREDDIRVLTGMLVYSTGAVRGDGKAEIVLQDGTRVQATPAEIVAE